MLIVAFVFEFFSWFFLFLLFVEKTSPFNYPYNPHGSQVKRIIFVLPQNRVINRRNIMIIVVISITKNVIQGYKVEFYLVKSSTPSKIFRCYFCFNYFFTSFFIHRHGSYSTLRPNLNTNCTTYPCNFAMTCNRKLQVSVDKIPTIIATLQIEINRSIPAVDHL